MIMFGIIIEIAVHLGHWSFLAAPPAVVRDLTAVWLDHFL